MKKKKQKEVIKEKSILENQSMGLFYLLSGYMLFVLILYTAFQFIKFNNCLGVVQILSIIIPILIYLYKKQFTKNNIITVSIFLFITIIFPFIYSNTYDLTVDGNTYHKTAIAYIKNGWNPLYESTLEFQEKNSNVIAIDKDSNVDLWVEHYPKGTWIMAANIYNMTNNIESGKSIIIMLIVMMFILTYNILRKVLDTKWSLIICALISLNPIILPQIFSYYVDGIMGISFIIELLLLFLINPKEKTNKLIWISLATTCIFFTNIKFTGLLCSGVIAATFYFYWLIKYRKDKEFINIFKRVTINFSIIFILAIFFVGANSYVKNTIEHLNPLYPLFGEDKVDIITTMQPKSFGDKNIFEKFAISLFSKTQNATYEIEPTLKLPFIVYKSEINELFAPDVRMAGFGPLFALAVILSLIVMAVNIAIFIKNERNNIKYIILPVIAIIVSMLLLGESWWARYVPQFYLLPIGAIILSIYNKKYYKNRIVSKVFSYALTAILIVNTSFFLFINYKEILSFIEIKSDLKEMRQTENLELKVTNPEYYGYYYNLNDNHIKYTIDNDITEENGIYKYSWRMVVKQK